jgi:ABC-type sugar transport system ATPase subunit
LATAATAGAKVEARGITKTYGAAVALANVTVAVEPGTIHALVGENGAGKSTLGKIIAGAVSPSQGEILVDDEVVSYRSPRDAIRLGIAIIDQELAMVPTLSVLDNVFLGAELGRWGTRDQSAQRDAYRVLADQLGMTVGPDEPAGALRVADQQKTEIMRALVRNARLIVMDEPTAALSRDEARRLLEVTRELSASGVTIIFVSHFLEDVLALCHTITVLKDGEHVSTSPAEGQTHDGLVTAMIGRPVDLHFPTPAPCPADAPTVLSVRELSRPPSFSGISFEMKAGEILGLAGLVGSGRTEIARAIFGADASTGEIELAGAPIQDLTIRQRIGRGLAMLPESRKDQGLVMGRPVNENITLVHLDAIRTRMGLNRKVEEKVVAAAMERSDVRAASQAMPVGALSGGNQQKASLAKWLVRPPKVLLADEPTRGIDVGAKLGIYHLLGRLAAQGMAILLISSEIEEVLGLSHRILVLRQGRVAAELEGGAGEESVMRIALGGAPLDEPPRAGEGSDGTAGSGR